MANFNVWDGASFKFRGYVEADNADVAIAWIKTADPACHAPIVAPRPATPDGSRFETYSGRFIRPDQEFRFVHG